MQDDLAPTQLALPQLGRSDQLHHGSAGLLLRVHLQNQMPDLISQLHIGLSKGDTAFILSLNLVQVLILYFSLLLLGVIISPANPINTESEISKLVQLCNPVIAFATSSTAHKLPTLQFKTICLDSLEFDSSTKARQSQSEPIQFGGDHVLVRDHKESQGSNVDHRNLMAVVAVSCVN
jgi:acyl-CoA synthetase (AMP-forming)/AMP-acid ligase II